MPRSGINGVFDWGPGDGSVNPNTTIASARENSVQSDVRQTFNTIWPISLLPVQDGTWYFENTADTTKRIKLDLSGITTGNTYTWTVPNKSGTLAMLSDIGTQKGYIYGLTLSNNVTDPTNDINVAAGECASDAATPIQITLASQLTKRLDASWAVGNAQGMLDTGAVANNTYHIFLIRRSDTGVVDVLASLSATSPTMPANYDQKRRIGSIVRGGGLIRAFRQNGDRFWLQAPVADWSVNTPGNTETTRSISVPTGIGVIAILSVTLQHQSSAPSGTPIPYRVYETTQPDATPDVSNATLWRNQNSGHSISAEIQRYTTTAQIKDRLDASTAATTVYGSTLGWIDRRGRD